MKWRIAINGYGRIGQCVLRALFQSPHRKSIELVAINELADIETIAYLTRYDSTHGRFPGHVDLGQDAKGAACLVIDGQQVSVTHHSDISDLPWAELDIDLVLECTGEFAERKDGDAHIAAGAKRVMFSQPAEADIDRTIVMGVNENSLCSDDQIISNASCTTNALAPVLEVLDREFGIVCGSTTTIHSAMNDQPIIDAYHNKDLRRTRSAMCNVVPVDTALAKGVERIMPRLQGKLTSVALRVPTVNVSAIDLTIQCSKEVSASSVNSILKNAAEGDMAGILEYTDEPLASSDFMRSSFSGTIDGSQTRVSGNTLVKVLVWFDNEWGYANRMLDLAVAWKSLND